MTRQINQGDHEVAQILLAAGREQGQIAAALVYRGLDEPTANRLVEDKKGVRRMAIHSTDTVAEGRRRNVGRSEKAAGKPSLKEKQSAAPLLTREEFECLVTRYNNRRYANTFVYVGTLIGVIKGIESFDKVFSSTNQLSPKIFLLFGLWAFLALLLVLGVALSAQRLIRCPACGKQLTSDLKLVRIGGGRCFHCNAKVYEL